MSNTFKSVILLGTLTGLLVVMGQVLGGNTGMIIAFGMAVVMNFASYWFSDQIAMRMAGAREVSPEEAPQLHAIVEQLAYQAQLPKPRVAIVESPSPNAFATGRDKDHSLVAVTTGILQILNRDELMAVLGHELGHVKNRDILVTSIAATVAGAIMMIAHMLQFAAFFGGLGGYGGRDERGGMNPLAALAMIILAPIAATMIQMAISRSREYGADDTGAHIVGDPLALASALAKLEAGSKRMPMDVSPAAAPLFIVNPLSGQMIAGLFSTHPPIEERIKRLRQMAGYPA
ncbi:MAG: zinc metalloprotease HtpX [Chloroflexota bacterium]